MMSESDYVAVTKNDIADFSSKKIGLFKRSISKIYKKICEDHKLSECGEATVEGAEKLYSFLLAFGEVMKNEMMESVLGDGDVNVDNDLLQVLKVSGGALQHSQSSRKLKVAFLGSTGAGKSYLFNRLLVGGHMFPLSRSDSVQGHGEGITRVPIKAVYCDKCIEPRFRLCHRDGSTSPPDDGWVDSYDAACDLVEEDGFLNLKYLCIEVKVKSQFLLENNIELIDLPGLQRPIDLRICEPFLCGEHRVDLLLQFGNARAPNDIFVKQLWDTKLFCLNPSVDDIPRVVELINERSAFKNDGGDLISEMAFDSQQFRDAIGHQEALDSKELYLQITRLRERGDIDISLSAIHHIRCRFGVALFQDDVIDLQERLLNRSRSHFSEVIADTYLMRNFRVVTTLLQNWKRLVVERKELATVMLHGEVQAVADLCKDRLKRSKPRERDFLESLEEKRTSLGNDTECDPSVMLKKLESVREEVIKDLEESLAVWEVLVINAKTIKEELRVVILDDIEGRKEDLANLGNDDDANVNYSDAFLTRDVVGSFSMDSVVFFFDKRDENGRFQDMLDVCMKKMDVFINFWKDFRVEGGYAVFRPKNAQSGVLAATASHLKSSQNSNISPRLKKHRSNLITLENAIDTLISMVAPHLHWRKHTSVTLDSTSGMCKIQRFTAIKKDKILNEELKQPENLPHFNCSELLCGDENSAAGIDSNSWKCRFASINCTIDISKKNEPILSFSSDMKGFVESTLKSLGRIIPKNANNIEKKWLNPIFVLSKLRMTKGKVKTKLHPHGVETRSASGISKAKEDATTEPALFCPRIAPCFHLEQLSHEGDKALEKCVIAVVDGKLDGKEVVESEFEKYCALYFNLDDSRSALQQYLRASDKHYFMVLHINFNSANKQEKYVLNVGRKRQVVKLFAENVMHMEHYWMSDDDISCFRELGAGMDKAVTTSRALWFGQMTMLDEITKTNYVLKDQQIFDAIWRTYSMNVIAENNEDDIATYDRLGRIGTAGLIHTADLDIELERLSSRYGNRPGSWPADLLERLWDIRKKSSKFRVGMVGFIQWTDRLKQEWRKLTANKDFSHRARSCVYQVVLINSFAARDINYVEPDKFFHLFEESELSSFNQLRKCKGNNDVAELYRSNFRRSEKEYVKEDRHQLLRDAKDIQADYGFKHEDRRLVQRLEQNYRSCYVIFRYAFDVQPVKSMVNGEALEANPARHIVKRLEIMEEEGKEENGTGVDNNDDDDDVTVLTERYSEGGESSDRKIIAFEFLRDEATTQKEVDFVITSSSYEQDANPAPASSSTLGRRSHAEFMGVGESKGGELKVKRVI